MKPALIALALLLPVTAVADGRDAAFGVGELTRAIKKHDWKAVSTRIATPITYGGMWLPDPVCKRFAIGGVLKDKDRDALAKCLVKLSPMLSTRHSSRSDGMVLTVEPGLELEVVFDGSSLRWIGPAGPPNEDEGVPLLTAQTFEALRTKGSTLLDDALRGTLGRLIGESGKPSVVSAWMKTCIDDRGAVTKRLAITVQGTRISAAFEAASADWAFKPFAPRGVPTAACSLTLLSYPAARAPATEELPMSGAPPMRREVMDPDELWISP